MHTTDLFLLQVYPTVFPRLLNVHVALKIPCHVIFRLLVLSVSIVASCRMDRLADQFLIGFR